MNNEKQLSTSVKNAALSGGLTINSVDDLGRIGKMLEMSGYFQDASDAAKAGVKVLAGLELGVPVMASMSGINIVKGKPVMAANLMAACVKRHGKYNYRIRKHTNEECDIEFMEDGESVGHSTYTIAEAQKAGLTGKDNWKNYPKNMLFARALSNGVKWFASDVFLGAPVYTEDELADDVPKVSEKVVEDVIVVEEETPAPTVEPKIEPTEESHAAKVMREAKEQKTAEKKAEVAKKVQCEAAIGENERCEEMLSDAEVKFCNTTASKKMLCFIHQSDKK